MAKKMDFSMMSKANQMPMHTSKMDQDMSMMKSPKKGMKKTKKREKKEDK